MQLMPNFTNEIKFKAKFCHHMPEAALLAKLPRSGEDPSPRIQ